MKYKIIGKNDYYLNPIETVLNNRGIKEVDKFLDISNSVINHFSLLKNMDEATELLMKHVKKESNIFIQIDPDMDGFSSCSTLINYLCKVFPNISITYRLHEGKEHGVIVSSVPEDANLVIIPDAGSNQLKEHKSLQDKGIDVLVLDHHECNEESPYAVVVNSQISPDYSNKTLTGAGIVYKFLKALDEKLNINHADHYLDLVAVGNIGDVADTRNLETRYYIQKGLKQIKNSFLEALIEQQSFSLKGAVNITNIAFYIVPLVNATIRVGTMEEKEMVFKAFLESDEMVYYKKKETYEPIQKNAARMAYNLKNKQNRIRDKALGEIKTRVEEKKIDSNKIIFVNVDGILDKNFTGVVANKVAELYKRPVLLFRLNEKDDTVVGGSARGYEKSYVKELKDFLSNTNMFEFCEGHQNAHGFSIKIDKLIETNNYINDLLSEYEVTNYHDVDFVVPFKQFKPEVVKDIYKHKDIWGQKVEEPKIVVEGLEINHDEIFLNGAKKNTLKFKLNGIEYIKFFYNEDSFNTAFPKPSSRYVLNIVGRCSQNEWEGKITPQLLIEDFEVVEIKKKEWIF
jgi:single-stranded-DNA-specific exonuclease